MTTVHVSRRLTLRKAFLSVGTILLIVYIFERLTIVQQKHDTSQRYLEVEPAEEDPLPDRVDAILDRISIMRERLAEKYISLGIDDDMLERAILGRKYTETLDRLKNTILEVILYGKTLKIGVLGGSISAGAYLSNIDLMYANIYGNLLQEVVGTQVLVYNGAVGACGSNYFSYCTSVHLEIDNMDLILTELAVNDGLENAVSHERLIRYILELPNRPQIMYVHFMLGKMMRELGRCFNAEAFVLTPMSRHYNLPSVSFRKAVCPFLNASSSKIFTSGDNYNHPGEQGHELTALILFHFTTTLIQNICGRLLHQIRISPNFSSAKFMEENLANNDILPPPLFPDTHDVEFKCWSTLQPIISEKSHLKPVYNRGWNMYYPDMPKTRNDVATSWYTEQANTTIAFQTTTVSDFGPNTMCNVTLLTMTCQNCGKARVFLSKYKSSPIIADTRDIYRKMRLAVIANVKPDSYTVIVKTTGNDPFHVVGTAVSCYNVVNHGLI